MPTLFSPQFDPTKRKRLPLPDSQLPIQPDPSATGAMGAGAATRGFLKRQGRTALATGIYDVNSLTAPFRQAGGAIDDFTRGLAGAAPRAGVGRSFAGIAQPLYSDPAAASGDTGGIPATPPAASGAAPRLSDNVLSMTGNTAPNRAPTLFRGSGEYGNPTVADISAAGGIPAASSASTIDTGVTIPDGRKLPYGAMVNGVPTFSDGSGGMPGAPGTIPRTLTQDDIQALGGRLNTVPSTAFTNPVPAFNSDNSDENVANIMRSRQGGKFGITPEMNASADLVDVIDQNRRSALGRAALNASRSANAASTVLQRKAALNALNGIDSAAWRNYLAATEGQNRLDVTNAGGRNVLRRTGLAGQYDLAGIGERNAGQLANTNLARLYGIATNLARPNTRTALDPNKIGELAASLLQKSPQMFGLDQLGNVLDKTTGKTRPPTPQENQRILNMAREAAIRLYGAGPGPQAEATGPTQQGGTNKPSFEQVRAAALQQNPNLTDAQIRAYYKAKNYGS